MAYRAEIQIGVSGIGQLNALQKTLNQLNSNVDRINAKEVKTYFNIQNINTYNNKLKEAAGLVNRVKMGSPEEVQAIKTLVQAKNKQIAAQERLNRLIEREELLQRKIVATANAGFGVQGPKPAPVPSAAKRGPASPIGGAKNIPGSPAALAGGQEAALNAILGGAFPALFGAGPGAIFGGLAGGAIGGAMGGLGGMALSVGLSAVGQQIDTIIAATQKLGNDTRLLNVDNLRDSVIRVNAELTKSIRLLTEAGKTAEARTAIEQEITNQTGASAAAQRRITAEVNRLQNSWNEFLGTVGQFVGILAGPIISGLAEVLRLVTYILKPVNAVLSFLLRTAEVTGILTEEEEKRLAALEATSDAQLREMQHNKKMLDLEKQRTLGRTLAEKQLNTELDRRIAIEDIERKARENTKQFLTENAGLDQAALERGVKNIDILKKQELAQLNIKTNIQAQAFAYEKMQMQQELQLANAEALLVPIKAATVEIQKQQNSLEIRASVSSAYYQAETSLLGVQQQQLEREYELANSRAERLKIAERLFQVSVQIATTEYSQALENINLETRRLSLRLELEQSKKREIEAEASLQRLKVAGELEDVKRKAALQRINNELENSLANQDAVILAVQQQIAAQQQIAQYQAITAGAQLESKILTAQQQYEQKLVGKEIGFVTQKAGDFSKQLLQSIDLTRILALGMQNVAANAQAAALAASRIGGNPIAFNAIAPTGRNNPIQGRFAAGGYVSRPTRALIGEGGQGEYIVPESKAPMFAQNYLSGARGASALKNQSGDVRINITTGPVMQQNGQNYVTMQDMEAGLRAVASAVLSNGRSYGSRRFTGVT